MTHHVGASTYAGRQWKVLPHLDSISEGKIFLWQAPKPHKIQIHKLKFTHSVMSNYARAPYALFVQGLIDGMIR